MKKGDEEEKETMRKKKGETEEREKRYGAATRNGSEKKTKSGTREGKDGRGG